MSSTDYPQLLFRGERVTVVEYLKPRNAEQQEIVDRAGTLCLVEFVDRFTASALTSELTVHQ